MNYSTKARSNDSLQALFLHLVKKGYGPGQIKWAIREMTGLHGSNDMTAIRKAVEDVTMAELRGLLVERFPELDGLRGDVRRSAQQTIILGALWALGEWSTQVADTLQDKGFMGIQSSACSCPIATYLSAMLDPWAVSVSREVITVDGIEVEPTEPVKEFIRKFDDGEFQSLIAGVPASLA